MYEDIYENPAIAVQLFADLLELKRSDEVFMKVVEHSQLEEMRASSNIGLNHLRTGGIGGWRKYFTVAMNETFDDVCVKRIQCLFVYGKLLLISCCVLQVYISKMAGSSLRFNFGPNSQGKDLYL